MCGTKRLDAFSDYTRPVTYFPSAWVYLLLLLMGKIRLWMQIFNGASVRNGANGKVEVCALSNNLCITYRHNFYES